jgi:adenosylmethionine-8-amino-7-oxononanoate aminotransferase
LLIRPIGRTVYLMPPYLLNEEHVVFLGSRTLATLDAVL